MNPMNQGAKAAGVDARYRTMLIIWGALLMSVGLYFVLTMVLDRPSADDDNMLPLVFMAASIFPLLLSFVLKRKLQDQAARQQRPDLVQSAMILAVALCEMVGLFGLLVFFTTRTPYYYIFFIVSMIAILLHMPRRNQLLAASYKAQDF